MLWRSSVRTTSPVSAALRTLTKNTPLWSTEPVWHGQSGPVAPSWHHPQAKKKKKQTLERFQLWFDQGLQETEGFRAVHAYRQNHQKPRVHKILLWSFGTFASITFMILRNLTQPAWKQRWGFFLSFCMLWLNWRFFFKKYISSTYKLYAALMFAVGEASMVSRSPETRRPLQRRLWVTLFGGFQKISPSPKQFGGKLSQLHWSGGFLPLESLKEFCFFPPLKLFTRGWCWRSETPLDGAHWS